MRHIKLYAILIATMVTIFSSCQKQDELPIDNLLQTLTAYAPGSKNIDTEETKLGFNQNTSGNIELDWKVDDVITIYDASGKRVGNWKVESVASDGKANFIKVDGSTLTKDVNYTAVYPASGEATIEDRNSETIGTQSQKANNNMEHLDDNLRMTSELFQIGSTMSFAHEMAIFTVKYKTLEAPENFVLKLDDTEYNLKLTTNPDENYTVHLMIKPTAVNTSVSAHLENGSVDVATKAGVSNFEAGKCYTWNTTDTEDDDEEDDDEPAKAGVTINGINKSFTGVAKDNMVEFPTISMFFFSGTYSQASVEDGTMLDDIDDGAKWCGYLQATNMTNIDLTKTPDPNNIFMLALIGDGCIYEIYYNIDGVVFEAYCTDDSGYKELTLESGTISYNLTGDKVTINLNIELSDGHSIQIVHNGDVPDIVQPIFVEEIKFNKETLSLKVGETEKITITEILPTDAENKEIEWGSNIEVVATVDQDGNITAHKAGTATIYAVATDGGGAEASCEVTVTEADVAVDEDLVVGYWVANALSGTYKGMPLSLDILKGIGIDPVAFQFNSDKSGSSPFTTGSATWSVSGNKLTITASGIGATLDIDAISATEMTLSTSSLTLGTLGSATDVEITLAKTTPPVTTVNVVSVSLNKETLSLVEGKTETLVATVNPTNADNKNVTWDSNDKTVATVENGVVKAIKKGTATITVTTEDGSKTDTCVVTVVAPTGVNPPDIGSGGVL